MPSNIRLPLPTSRTKEGPRFSREGGAVTVEYDYEDDDGAVQWSSVAFAEVLVLLFRDSSCCAPEDVLPSTEARCLSDSALLSQVTRTWAERVGWQDWHQARGGAKRFHEYTMYFDDRGSVTLVASSMTVG